MATGRTVSASFLTERDALVIKLCDEISKGIAALISDADARKKFINTFGKTSNTRDGGMGVAAGKLQRDALCTRGRQGKAPYSNRNLRWHPLVVADTASKLAQPITRIEIEGGQLLVFVVNENGRLKKYPADKAHEMRQCYVVLPEHWMPHIVTLRSWDDTLWTQNSCVIPILEACEWQDAVESYAVLAIAVAVEFLGVDFAQVYAQVVQMLKHQAIDPAIRLPSAKFPKQKDEITKCPVCHTSIARKAMQTSKQKQIKVWQPAWLRIEHDTSEFSNIRLLHKQPLVENAYRHNAKNARYGHRWCDITPTDLFAR